MSKGLNDFKLHSGQCKCGFSYIRAGWDDLIFCDGFSSGRSLFITDICLYPQSIRSQECCSRFKKAEEDGQTSTEEQIKCDHEKKELQLDIEIHNDMVDKVLKDLEYIRPSATQYISSQWLISFGVKIEQLKIPNIGTSKPKTSMDWTELWKMLCQDPKQRDISHRIRGIEHEAGKITSAQWLAEAHPLKADDYQGEMRKETGDVIAMAIMLCCRMGWDYNEVVEEGKKGLLEFITTRMT